MLLNHKGRAFDKYLHFKNDRILYVKFSKYLCALYVKIQIRDSNYIINYSKAKKIVIYFQTSPMLYK